MAARALELVRELFDKAENEGRLREVWTLVTALRGPDSYGDENLKLIYTTPIRQCCLTHYQADKIGVDYWMMYSHYRLDKLESKEVDYSRGNTHFLSHIRSANRVING